VPDADRCGPTHLDVFPSEMAQITSLVVLFFVMTLVFRSTSGLDS